VIFGNVSDVQSRDRGALTSLVYERIYELQGQPSRLQSLHTHLLRTYYNSVIIALFRPFVAADEHTRVDNSLRTLATERCRTAASNTTYSLNELVSSDLIDVCPTMLITAMMSAMQIHFYEHVRLGGLARQHALHNLKLHIMVLDHLRKTYWTADMQHKLFSEALKAMESSKGDHEGKDGQGVRRVETPRRNSLDKHAQQDFPQQPFESSGDAVNDVALTNDAVLDDFFMSFNPFNISAFNQAYYASTGDWAMLGNGDVP
jgi:hypothetical protein